MRRLQTAEVNFSMSNSSSNPPSSTKVPPEVDGGVGRKDYPSAELIRRTIEIWEPRLGRTLTEEDARQILEKVVGAFRVLQEWDKRERLQTNGLNCPSDDEK